MEQKICFDPRAKMVVFIIAGLFSMNVTDYALVISFSGFLTILICISGKPKAAFTYFFVLIISSLISALLMKQEPNIGTTILLGIIVSVKLFVPIVMAFLFAFQTTTISQFLSALNKMKIPTFIVIPFAVFFRFLPTVKEEWIGIRQAMAFRGITGKGQCLLHPVQSVEHILVPLICSCVSIMDELVAASLVRGLDSEKERTCYLSVTLSWYDYMIIAVAIGFCLTIYL